MKISLNEVKIMQEAIRTLPIELPIKVSFQLARFLDKVSGETKILEATRIKLLEKLAKKDKDGKPLLNKEKTSYDLTENNKRKFEKDYFDLGKEEFEIDFKPIKLNQLGDIKLKPIVLVQLGKLIEE